VAYLVLNDPKCHVSNVIVQVKKCRRRVVLIRKLGKYEK
jgi:hypothetical protein